MQGQTNKKCVVMGGSFNPPTLAHEKLMAHAMAQVKAPYGIFVPSSHAYVRRKVSKAGGGMLFSESARARMLEGIAARHAGVSVSAVEFGDDGKGHTYRTMQALQKICPDRELYFLLGADKLHIIPKWHGIEAFLTEFRFAVTSRRDEDARALIRADPLLRKHADRFLVMYEPHGTGAISSTRARGAIAEALTLLDPGTAMLCMDEIARGEAMTEVKG